MSPTEFYKLRLSEWNAIITEHNRVHKKR